MSHDDLEGIKTKIHSCIDKENSRHRERPDKVMVTDFSPDRRNQAGSYEEADDEGQLIKERTLKGRRPTVLWSE